MIKFRMNIQISNLDSVQILKNLSSTEKMLVNEKIEELEILMTNTISY